MVRTLKLFILIVSASSFLFAQETVDKPEVTDISKIQFQKARFKTQGVGQLFSRLALGFDIPIGLELGNNEEDLRFYTLNFKGGSLSDLMNEAIETVNNGQNRYKWKMKKGVVRIFPEDRYRIPVLRALVDTHVDNFSIEKNTGCDGFSAALIANRNIKKALKINGINFQRSVRGGFYFPQMGRDFTLEAKNMSLKSVLDKAVRESPIAKFWVIGKGDSPETFFLILSAWQEDFPKKWRGVTFDGLEIDGP